MTVVSKAIALRPIELPLPIESASISFHEAMAKRRHSDATKRQSRRVIAQGDPL
jgi:hypothetical protein